jgi:23S rRNA (cytosine1962-C5)-methyltransferase
MPGIVVRPRSRIFHGHDWVYASEIQKTFGSPQPGDVISLKDFKDRPLGSAIYNPASQIVARRISRRKQVINTDFFRRRIERALQLRQRLPEIGAELCRLIWSEADGLPGVIVDRYHDHLVLQTLTLAMDQRKDMIAEVLVSLLEPASITERNDSPIRKAEGLDEKVSSLYGQTPEPFTIDVPGLGYSLTASLGEGHKTGLYLDQLQNYSLVSALARDRRILDVFSNQGGFALSCAMQGAREVRCVEVSEEACRLAQANALRCGASIDIVCANAFDFLKAADTNNEKFDIVILDPPSFTRSKKALREALRGYKEIHLRAMKILPVGGHLATYACSHHISWEAFLDVINEAAVDAKKTLRLVDRHTQRADHPYLTTLPETEYLKGFLFEVAPGS